jgi:hypothetical protein
MAADAQKAAASRRICTNAMGLAGQLCLCTCMGVEQWRYGLVGHIGDQGSRSAPQVVTWLVSS